MKYYLIGVDENDKKASFDIGYCGNLIIRNNNKKTRNVYVDKVIEYSTDDLSKLIFAMGYVKEKDFTKKGYKNIMKLIRKLVDFWDETNKENE